MKVYHYDLKSRQSPFLAWFPYSDSSRSPFLLLLPLSTLVSTGGCSVGDINGNQIIWVWVE